MRPGIVKDCLGPCGHGSQSGDAQRQRKHCRHCESRRLAQLAKRETEVASRVFEHLVHRVSLVVFEFRFVDFKLDGYSSRNACIGSIDAARRAGMTDAASASAKIESAANRRT